ncbi:hypothetical protein CDD82_6066 [Ophiocordyceps australis]|uniref:Nucleolar complex protein 14 n=1 Tax=Ophiocordyceps australis TaxID=1399860 RepID=A0A2C5ZUV0_9HYPO|nr:hypothetical protein CDD82_6066 [Ophiocordyceps australis]
MVGSQLKRLRASLREQGITGPQQSKKQKRQRAQHGHVGSDKRLQRGIVLQGIHEQFNPFDIKHAARGPKFSVTTNRPAMGDAAKGIKGRPGLAKAAGEERRRETLLVDMQHRNKIGGIIDRRFGENDPSIAPEEKMLERFAREKQASHKKNAIFDLEDDAPLNGGLTHMGKPLVFDQDDESAIADDFREFDLDEDQDSDDSVRGTQRLKRMRAMVLNGQDDDEPERKKTKKEVMQEVIAKSKLHKYERQAAKADDADLRAELDKGLPSIKMLFSFSDKNTAHPATAAALAPATTGSVHDVSDKDYNLKVKRLAQDKRAQPTERTKTEEEQLEEKANILKELETKRQRRMLGEEASDSDDDEQNGQQERMKAHAVNDDDDDDDFGLGGGLKSRPRAKDHVFDDEDDFIIDDGLIASGSDIESMGLDEHDSDTAACFPQETQTDEDEDFIGGLFGQEETKKIGFKSVAASSKTVSGELDERGLPYTFVCPQSCQEFTSLAEPYPQEALPTIIQRIRTLYHPGLDSDNKVKLARFAEILVEFISQPWDAHTSPPFLVLESIIRHIHSLAKSYPIQIARRFRHEIQSIARTRPLSLLPSDLLLLTAVGTIFPTSDHFHQVVTPAMLTIGRFLGQRVPRNLSDYVCGTYLSILALQYQQRSKRYVPELINFCLNALCALSPVPPKKKLGNFPQHEPPTGIRLRKDKIPAPRRLRLLDCIAADVDDKEAVSVKMAVIDTCIQLLDVTADVWTGKSAFLETLQQVMGVIRHLMRRACREYLPSQTGERIERIQAKLERMMRLAQMARRPLELHHHRPLAIKSYVPRFEDSFNPDKHYDPDRERAELAKLQKEHKRERKGAMRELRKDAHFMAREKLRIKKAKDEAYEKKFQRIVSEIQSEEGREANAYKRDMEARKRARNK